MVHVDLRNVNIQVQWRTGGIVSLRFFAIFIFCKQLSKLRTTYWSGVIIVHV